MESPPMWGRGLKHGIVNTEMCVTLVAPHVGAWIETNKMLIFATSNISRPPCGGVD